MQNEVISFAEKETTFYCRCKLPSNCNRYDLRFIYTTTMMNHRAKDLDDLFENELSLSSQSRHFGDQ